MLRYKQAIKLREEGLSYREIAKKMGIAVSTVKSSLYRRRHTEKLLEKQRKANRKYYQKHRDKILRHHKEYRNQNKERLTEKRRRTVLQTKQGKITGLNKRAYPADGCCELCGESKRLGYHHWNGREFSMGMWICQFCHIFTERFEKGHLKKYLELKKKITEKFTDVEQKQL